MKRKQTIPNIQESQWREITQTNHPVQFYNSDAFLIETVKNFVLSGDIAIVVATKEHRDELDKILKVYLADRPIASLGKYILLDAYETLAKFMVDDMPDPHLFYEVIGGIISKASRPGKRLRAFGEMVAILWEQGNQKAAIRLEELWNELQITHSFSLLCAYPTHFFKEKNSAESFNSVCIQHSEVFSSQKV